MIRQRNQVSMNKYLARGVIFLTAFAGGTAVVFWVWNHRQPRNSTSLVTVTDAPRLSSLACLDNDQIYVEIVRNALLTGVRVDSTNESCIRGQPSPERETLLMMVASRGDIDVAKLLLESGADINRRDTFGETPLSRAAWSGNVEMVRFLLAKGANCNLGENLEGQTPLMIAAWNGHVEVIDWLLDGGAHINARDVNRTTPLMYAAGFNQPEAVRELLKRGANAKLKDKRGLTVAYYTKHGFPDGYLLIRE
jgi:ankyrin repeat protein